MARTQDAALAGGKGKSEDIARRRLRPGKGCETCRIDHY
jgi:hypothetical protein